MSAALRYLEEAKIEEVAREYASKGFTIAKDHQDNGATYDLVASDGQKKIAIEVRARAALAGHVKEIVRLREIAQEHGYDFQLIIVNPPAERTIRVEGLGKLLRAYLTDHPPAKLAKLSARRTIDAVRALDLRSIRATPAGTAVEGMGLIDMTLEEDHCDHYWEGVFPFDFALSLDREFAIAEVDRLDIDLSDVGE